VLRSENGNLNGKLERATRNIKKLHPSCSQGWALLRASSLG
jgi:hypothetical protein